MNTDTSEECSTYNENTHSPFYVRSIFLFVSFNRTKLGQVGKQRPPSQAPNSLRNFMNGNTHSELTIIVNYENTDEEHSKNAMRHDQDSFLKRKRANVLFKMSSLRCQPHRQNSMYFHWPRKKLF